ncbi:amidohydrolase family protein [Rhodococcus sp. IEGM 248]|uniref:amidohydrolase family protein n=1 Tax=Rhodococcus opacus TaxID=37919 RepID=UPI0013C172AA|nr:amidohydrolase family protein [Rhodococcus opacus]MDV7090185.1 amidohydrolase family protein [Rhodococcus opacus]NDV10521.1 amidohydrolase family protein [Rhodococcus sp. IEGM 248]
MFDIVIRRAVLSDSPFVDPNPVDVGITAGVVTEIGPSLGAGDTELDADGCLVAAGFVETHIHLDKSRTADRCTVTTGTLQEAIAETTRIKGAFTEEDVYVRAERTLRDCLLNGTTVLRTQIEVDTAIELRGWHAIRQLARDYAGAADFQCCVFAQEGLTNSPEGDALLVRALNEGADVIGGAPYADPDPAGQLDRVFALARDFDVDIDLHLDLAEDVEGMQLEQVCLRTVEAGWHGRVTVGHVTQMSLLSLAEQARLADLVADAAVAVTVLPSTDLFLMGRRAEHTKPRGVLPLHTLLERGVRCSVATNNVLNAFTPYGDGSLVRAANLYANIAHLATPSELEQAFALIGSSAGEVLGLGRRSVRTGAQADLVCLDCGGAAEAVSTVAQPLWGMKDGRVTFNRARPELLAPVGSPA